MFATDNRNFRQKVTLNKTDLINMFAVLLSFAMAGNITAFYEAMFSTVGQDWVKEYNSVTLLDNDFGVFRRLTDKVLLDYTMIHKFMFFKTREEFVVIYYETGRIQASVYKIGAGKKPESVGHGELNSFKKGIGSLEMSLGPSNSVVRLKGMKRGYRQEVYDFFNKVFKDDGSTATPSDFMYWSIGHCLGGIGTQDQIKEMGTFLKVFAQGMFGYNMDCLIAWIRRFRFKLEGEMGYGGYHELAEAIFELTTLNRNGKITTWHLFRGIASYDVDREKTDLNVFLRQNSFASDVASQIARCEPVFRQLVGEIVQLQGLREAAIIDRTTRTSRSSEILDAWWQGQHVHGILKDMKVFKPALVIMSYWIKQKISEKSVQRQMLRQAVSSYIFLKGTSPLLDDLEVKKRVQRFANDHVIAMNNNEVQEQARFYNEWMNEQVPTFVNPNCRESRDYGVFIEKASLVAWCLLSNDVRLQDLADMLPKWRESKNQEGIHEAFLIDDENRNICERAFVSIVKQQIDGDSQMAYDSLGQANEGALLNALRNLLREREHMSRRHRKRHNRC